MNAAMIQVLVFYEFRTKTGGHFLGEDDAVLALFLTVIQTTPIVIKPPPHRRPSYDGCGTIGPRLGAPLLLDNNARCFTVSGMTEFERHGFLRDKEKGRPRRASLGRFYLVAGPETISGPRQAKRDARLQTACRCRRRQSSSSCSRVRYAMRISPPFSLWLIVTLSPV